MDSDMVPDPDPVVNVFALGLLLTRRHNNFTPIPPSPPHQTCRRLCSRPGNFSTLLKTSVMRVDEGPFWPWKRDFGYQDAPGERDPL